MAYEIVVVGALDTNCYLFYGPGSPACAIIDPGAEPGKIFAAVAALELKPALILNTHGHVDHIGANRDMKEKYGVPLYLHSADASMLKVTEHVELSLLLGARDSPAPDRLLVDGDEIAVGGETLRVIHTPGHTPGSVGFLAAGVVFSGDTLFCGGVGRTDLEGGSWKDLDKSIRERLFVLPAETIVLPGHGPWTTVGEEKLSNPFFT
ncbi:MAG TPA: MBL fold metallo-hydrolase [Terriglobales bacterium]|nr:MBL fold metallo-hydrolase [Terriglobales bacterium]